MAIKNLLPWKKSNELEVKKSGDPIHSFRESVNSLFDDFFKDFADWDYPALQRDIYPNISLKDSEKEIQIEAEIPGVDKDHFDISISNDVLTIKGEKKEEKKEENAKYFYEERTYGSFLRNIALPCEVEEDKIEATYKNGVLKIRLPKSKAASEKIKKIKVTAK